MKRLLLYTLFAILFAACTQNEINEQSVNRQEVPETLTVGFEGDDTRIQLNSAQKTVWTKDDQVSVFYRSNANQLWQYNGETGARTATLKRVNAGTASRDMDRVVVVYPYNEDYYINPSTYNIQASLPATQHYLDGSYGLDGNIMISSSEYNQFSLKSVCGWLKLQLTGNGEVVKSITLRGNNSEQVAGELYINSADATAVLASEMGSSDDNNAGGSLVFDNTIFTEVTLDCGEGVALGKNTTAFYIALPPQTFEQGFTVEIEDTEGYVLKQSSDKVLIIERNHIQPMAAFEFINPATPSAPAPASNEIWYTATEKADPYFDDFLTFGSNVVSNVWDSETKRGVIAFDGDVTMIGDDAFSNCDKFTGITLPESVTSIGKSAFSSCEGLTSIIIPDNVTTIGNQAFSGCRSLAEFNGKFAEDNGRILVVDGTLVAFAPAGITEYTIPDSVTTIGENAFSYCTSLTSVTIPNSVTEIGDYAFYQSPSLKKVYCYATVPPTLLEDNSYGYGYGYVFYGNATGLRIYVYEECVELYKSAWSDYKDSIYTNGKNCPETTTIEYTTNDGNTISSSKLPIISNIYENGVGTLVYSGKQIPNEAFYYCKSLTSVNIPDSVTTIGVDAFRYCYSLTSVYCKAVTPPALGGTYVFYSNGSGRKIYVPAESVDAYKSATNWSEYASAIVGYDFDKGEVVE